MRYFIQTFEHLPLWPKLAGPVFFLLFLGIVWWVYRGDRKQVYARVEQLPLEDDDRQGSGRAAR